MSVQRDKIAAELRAARKTIEALEADVANAPRAMVTGPESIQQELADAVAVEAASVAGLLLDGLCELVTGDQFDIEDELSFVMQRQIKAADRDETPVHIETPKSIDYRARELGVGRYA